MPKYANSQAAFYAVQQAPPPMPMPPPIPIETSATVGHCLWNNRLLSQCLYDSFLMVLLPQALWQTSNLISCKVSLGKGST